jgi:hypothetical protein
MAASYWSHLGRDFTYALVVEGRIVGIAHWLDAEILDESDQHEPVVADPGWFWTAIERPEERQRVAHGLELTAEMGEEERGQIVRDALDVIATEVLAEGGGGEWLDRGIPYEVLAEGGDDERPDRGSHPDTRTLVVAALVLIVWAVARRRGR